MLRVLCKDVECTLLAVGGTADHVHVLLTFPATQTIADVVRRLKGGTSRFVNELRLGAFFKWQGHCGAFTVSAHERNKVRRYVDNQRAHHAANTLWPSGEETSEEDAPQ